MKRTILYAGGTFAGTLALATFVNDVRLPGGLEDAARIIVVGQACFGVVLMAAMIDRFSRMKFHPSTKRLASPCRGHVIAYFGLSLYVAFDMVERIHNHEALSWRVPEGAVIFVVSIISLLKFIYRVKPIVDVAVATDATVKVTATDTSKPGPDLDLEEIPK